MNILKNALPLLTGLALGISALPASAAPASTAQEVLNLDAVCAPHAAQGERTIRLLAGLFAVSDRQAAAASAIERAVGQCERVRGAKDAHLVPWLIDLTFVYLLNERERDARATLRRAYRIANAQRGTGDEPQAEEALSRVEEAAILFGEMKANLPRALVLIRQAIILSARGQVLAGNAGSLQDVVPLIATFRAMGQITGEDQVPRDAPAEPEIFSQQPDETSL
jgi:hypothetical protein